jgi:hypothetical protein
MLLWNIASYIKGETQAEVIWKQDTKASIWAQGGCEWRVNRLHSEEARSLYCSPNVVRWLNLEA